MVELCDLPDDALLQVLACLPERELLGLRVQCRRLRDLALHPHLWRTRRLDDKGNAKLCGAVLRLAPCLSRLAVSQSALMEHLSLTNCVLKHLSVAVPTGWKVTRMWLRYALRALDNLGDLGQLKTLDASVPIGNNAHYASAFINAAIRVRGLEVLNLKVDDDYCLRRMNGKNMPSPASLREFSFHGQVPCDLTDLVLSAYAPTLEVVRMTGYCGYRRFTCSLDVPNLRELHYPLSLVTNVTPLLRRHRQVTNVTFWAREGSWHIDIPALKALAAFLREATWLTDVHFTNLVYSVVAAPAPADLDVVRALAATGASAVQSLAFGGSPCDLTALNVVLPRLRCLRALRLGREPWPGLLQAISPDSAPNLRELEVHAYSNACTHAWLHDEVQPLLAFNPRLHVVLSQLSTCLDCGACAAGCHARLESGPGDKLGLFGHPKEDACEVCGSKQFKSVPWMEI